MAGLFVLGIFVIINFNFKRLAYLSGLLLITGILSIGLIVAIVRFPYPDPVGGFLNMQVITDRASKITGEAAVSSRWNLLPKLWEEILKAPFLGQGFGATVTYKSSDPRVLESSPTGEYTAYAFEWGWLDIWLKLGLFGLIAYLALIGKVLKSTFPYFKKNNLALGAMISLIVICFVNIFTPYMNHPLGIGYLISISVVVDGLSSKS